MTGKGCYCELGVYFWVGVFLARHGVGVTCPADSWPLFYYYWAGVLDDCDPIGVDVIFVVGLSFPYGVDVCTSGGVCEDFHGPFYQVTLDWFLFLKVTLCCGGYPQLFVSYQEYRADAVRGMIRFFFFCRLLYVVPGEVTFFCWFWRVRGLCGLGGCFKTGLCRVPRLLLMCVFLGAMCLRRRGEGSASTI